MLQFLLTLSDESGHGKIEHIFGTAKEQGSRSLMRHSQNHRLNRWLAQPLEGANTGLPLKGY